MHDIITIGTATRDVFLKSSLFKEFIDEDLKKIGIESGVAECFVWGGKVEVEKPVITTGGGATNAAVTFARQGFKTASFFAIGDDRPGAGIVEELKSEGVRCFALKNNKLGTGYSTILLSEKGERTVLVYRGAANNINIKNLPHSELKSKFAYITPGHVELPVIYKMSDILFKNGSKIAIDLSDYYLKMGIKKLKPLLNKMHIVKGNLEEIRILIGSKEQDKENLLKEFKKSIPGIAVISDGPRGVLVADGNYIYSAGTFVEKKVADRTGAGDAFGSGFVAGLIRESKKYKTASASWKPESIEYAIRLGSANATSVVEYIGAKEGILKSGEFSSARWKKFKIIRKNLNN